MSEQTPVEVVREFLEDRKYNPDHPMLSEVAAACEAFEEVVDISSVAHVEVREFRAQLAEAQKDTERLDWTENTRDFDFVEWDIQGGTLRQAIDAFRTGDK